jgi:photosystem II stability/assembly factor-like uncharacterized protein
MRKTAFAALLLNFLYLAAYSQEMAAPAATKGDERLNSFRQRQRMEAASLVKNVRFRSIGPTVMSGRVVDLDVSPTDPTHFYVAYASGGLWKTTNNGISFTPLFDQEAVMTIGDIAVDWKNGETIWVGTGESNSSRSSYAGTGIYKSTDGGRSWQHLGLPESHHTGKIVLHPTDPNTAWVAALGHLYSANRERGVYKTSDGGRSWQHTLFVHDQAGAIDLEVDPGDPRVVYAATWERARLAWNFVEGGAGSGIYKSTDGGTHWRQLNTAGSGLPAGPQVGRIGLALCPSQPQTLYAIVDNQAPRPADTTALPAGRLTRDLLRRLSREQFGALSDEIIQAFLGDNNFPKKYTAAGLKEQVRRGELQPVTLAEYQEDANTRQAGQPVTGAEVYRSDNGGHNWRKTHDISLASLYYSFGYYFGKIHVAPNNPDKVYIYGVPLLRSDDGGRTFVALDAANVHADHHALWISGTRPGHLINGNDGGVNITYDDGANWIKANMPAVGQFYTVTVDMEKPYNVYGGLQDNGVWVGPSTYPAGAAWHQEGRYPYQRLLGGDGMQVAVDTRDNTTVYAGTQYGNYFRLNRKTGERVSIKPRQELGEPALRFNWQTPVHLSRHNPDVVYLGSNKFHRSQQRGEHMETLSGDLTRGGRPGDVGYGTLTTIDESPLQQGLIYAGSDDGLVQVSEDGGSHWTRISDKLPGELWVSRVVASGHATTRVYVALNGYRWDDFRPYLYVSENRGRSWRRLGTDLPLEPINVVREDPQNPDLLYVGTDHGVYISMDRGKTFMPMRLGLPAVAVHDLVVHPRDHELVVATHGRSLFVAPVTHVQALTPSLLRNPVYPFALPLIYYQATWGHRNAPWEPAQEPEHALPFYLAQAGVVTVRIKTEQGLVLKTITVAGSRGLNYPTYDLSLDPAALAAYSRYLNENRRPGEAEINFTPTDTGRHYLRPGRYRVEMETSQGAKAHQALTVQAVERRGR